MQAQTPEESKDITYDLNQYGQAKFQEYSFHLNIQNSDHISRLTFIPLVDYLQLAYDQSFVVLLYGYKLQHYSSSGELKKELYFEHPNRIEKKISVFMANDKTVVSIIQNYNRPTQLSIIEWDLKTYEQKLHNFSLSFSLDIVNQHQYYFVSTSETVLISETDRKQLKFSYLKLSDPNHFDTVLLQLPECLQKRKLCIGEANHSSLFILQKNLSKTGKIPFGLFCKQNKQSRLRCFEVQPKLSFEKFCSIRITDLFQLKPNLLYLKIGIEPDPDKVKDFDIDCKLLKQYEKQIDFIYSDQTGLKQIWFGTHKTHITQFTDSYRQMALQKYERAYVNALISLKTAQISQKLPFNGLNMVNYFERQKLIDQFEVSFPNSEEVQILYVDRKTLAVIQTQKIQIPIMKHYYFSGNHTRVSPIRDNPKLFMQFQIINKTASIKIKKCKQLPMPLGLVYAHFLCSLCQDPDQDMIQSTLELLNQEEQDLWKWNKGIKAKKV